jgi:hypothetical protein
MYIDASAMIGPAGIPMMNGDWDLRPQEVCSPDNCTRLCSETPACQYTLFIRFGTSSRWAVGCEFNRELQIVKFTGTSHRPQPHMPDAMSCMLCLLLFVTSWACVVLCTC